MSLPTKREINPVEEDLDGQAACRHFFGKTLTEATAMLREEPHIYEEDLMWMGPVAFCFYIEAVIQLLQSEGGPNCGSLVAWFADVLEFRLENDRLELLSVAQPLAELCGYVDANWPRFALVADRYGDVHSRYRALQLQLAELSSPKKG